jgi:hypothetical protein
VQFTISIDLGPIVAALKGVMNEKVLPELHQAVLTMAERAREDWQTAIYHAKLWQGERDHYANSIKIEETGPYAARIWAEYRYAEEIETGRPAYDMKVMLRTSNKTRMGKKGLYLIIPFRHNIKTMPAAVYKAAKALAPSKVTSIGTRVSATGATVAQNKYAWGGRLKSGAVPQMLRKHAGMVKFEQSTPGAARSGYLTFRVMSQNSTGWIKPAQPGIHLLAKVVEGLRPQCEAAFSAALASASAVKFDPRGPRESPLIL